MIFKTYKRPNGKTETRAYFNPYRTRWGRKLNVRKSKPTEAEIKARSLFTKRREYVAQLIAGDPSLSRKEAWKIAKQEIK